MWDYRVSTATAAGRERRGLCQAMLPKDELLSELERIASFGSCQQLSSLLTLTFSVSSQCCKLAVFWARLVGGQSDPVEPNKVDEGSFLANNINGREMITSQTLGKNFYKGDPKSNNLKLAKKAHG